MTLRARDVQAILAERARQLALPDDGPRLDPTEPYTVFALGGQLFGAPLAGVSRADDVRHLTEVPGAPPWLLGVTAIAGRLLSLIDLATMFELKRRDVGPIGGCLVVLDGGRAIALAAERLVSIVDLPRSSIAVLEPARGAITRVAAFGQAEHLLIDLGALFADPRLAGSG